MLLCSVLCHLNPTCSCVFHVSLHASDAKVEVLSFPIIYCAVCSLLFTADAELDVIDACVRYTAMCHLFPPHLNRKQAKLWPSLSSPRSTADAVACIEACVCCIAMPSHLISSHLTTKDTIAAFPLPSLPSPQMLSWTLSRPVCTATCRSQREEGRRGARSCNTYSVGPTAEPLGTRSQCFILQHLVVAVDPQSQWMCIVYCHEIHYQAGLHCDSSAAP